MQGIPSSTQPAMFFNKILAYIICSVDNDFSRSCIVIKTLFQAVKPEGVAMLSRIGLGGTIKPRELLRDSCLFEKLPAKLSPEFFPCATRQWYTSSRLSMSITKQRFSVDGFEKSIIVRTFFFLILSVCRYPMRAKSKTLTGRILSSLQSCHNWYISSVL